MNVIVREESIKKFFYIGEYRGLKHYLFVFSSDASIWQNFLALFALCTFEYPDVTKGSSK